MDFEESYCLFQRNTKCFRLKKSAIKTAKNSLKVGYSFLGPRLFNSLLLFCERWTNPVVVVKEPRFGARSHFHGASYCCNSPTLKKAAFYYFHPPAVFPRLLRKTCNMRRDAGPLSHTNIKYGTNTKIIKKKAMREIVVRPSSSTPSLLILFLLLFSGNGRKTFPTPFFLHPKSQSRRWEKKRKRRRRGGAKTFFAWSLPPSTFSQKGRNRKQLIPARSRRLLLPRT